MEHYVTLFDGRFLLQGLALHESLRRHHPGSCLWVLCLDAEAEQHLQRLGLPGMRLLPLRALETPELLAAKRQRSRTDYIFTLTPFVFELVFDQDPSVRRVTYLDADVFFYGSPAGLIGGLERAGRQILITEHGYAPGFRHLARSFGRFCVQFLSVSRTPEALRVTRRWGRQCLENCTTDLAQRGVFFGDQKYLDDWPEKYPGVVHVCPDRWEMLGPWNVDHYQARAGRPYAPVFYHFHSFRIFHRGWVQLCAEFKPRAGRHLYREYLAALRRQDRRLAAAGIPRPVVPFAGDRLWLPRLAWRCLRGRARVRPFGGVGRKPLAAPADTVGTGVPPVRADP